MRRDRDTLDQEVAAFRAAEIESRREYAEFCARVASLGPLEKVASWLQYIADHRTADSDLEALVFLASRGHDLTAQAAQVMTEWKEAERDRISEYNRGKAVYHLTSGRAGRRKRPAPVSTNDIASTSRVNLPDFWCGRDEQQLTIDATMLRATEWLRIGGFDHWWDRLARETAEDVVLGGGFDGMAGAFWLFGMCRSGYALTIMASALNRALDAITIPRIKAPLPWQDIIPTRRRAKAVLSDHIPCASAIVFAEHRLHRPTELSDQAIGTIQRHYENGSWPVWTGESAPSVEATAMAMHALAVLRPRGWEHMMAGASSWLLHVQHKEGYWGESGTPDAVFLTVLVMDALNLASRPPGPLTFRDTLPAGPAGPESPRFRVAFSFPGETRQRIESIANTLAGDLGREKIFYDTWYKAVLAQPNLDTHLQQIYHDRADLIVVVLCADYQHKDWCHLEWRAIRDLIKKRHENIMFLRMDDADVDGVFSIDGYVDLRQHDDAEVARLILQRLTLTRPARGRDRFGAATLLSEHLTIDPGTTAQFDIGLTRNECVQIDVQSTEQIELAVCSPTVFRSWRSAGGLAGSLCHFKNVRKLRAPITAPRKSTYHLLLINSGKKSCDADVKISAGDPGGQA